MQDKLTQQLEHLFSLRSRGIKPGLMRINNLLDFLGHPEKDYPIIHVAGTNGKGSTCRIMHTLLVAAGYKTGLYTSPHLLRFNERIKVNDEEISDAALGKLFEKFDQYLDESRASFFEITTAMALDYFCEQKVDLAILEVGLGGRFDATNAVTPKISVITSISKDHEEFLGSELDQIAREKAGIIKKNIPIVTSKQTAVVSKILQNISKSTSSKFFSAPKSCNIQINKLDLNGQNLNLQINNQFFKNINYPLLGAHQLENLKAALTALSIFPGVNYTQTLINSGLKRLQNHGRFEIIKKEPVIIYDVAHNTAGIKAAIATVKKLFPGKKIDLLVSFKATKRLEKLGEMFRELKGTVYITEMENTESIKSEKLISQIKDSISETKIIQNPNMKSLITTLTQNRKEPLLILGSHYMADNVYNFLKTI
jgi:dihydrofolate synthase/folylpolyglutamate synthase